MRIGAENSFEAFANGTVDLSQQPRILDMALISPGGWRPLPQAPRVVSPAFTGTLIVGPYEYVEMAAVIQYTSPQVLVPNVVSLVNSPDLPGQPGASMEIAIRRRAAEPSSSLVRRLGHFDYNLTFDGGVQLQQGNLTMPAFRVVGTISSGDGSAQFEVSSSTNLSWRITPLPDSFPDLELTSFAGMLAVGTDGRLTLDVAANMHRAELNGGSVVFTDLTASLRYDRQLSDFPSCFDMEFYNADYN